MLKMWNSCPSKGLSSVRDSCSEVPASFADITLQAHRMVVTWVI